MVFRQGHVPISSLNINAIKFSISSILIRDIYTPPNIAALPVCNSGGTTGQLQQERDAALEDVRGEANLLYPGRKKRSEP